MPRAGSRSRVPAGRRVKRPRASLRSIAIYPPLAFARLGRSDVPCDAFVWGPNDVRPRGTGKTTIQPAQTLHVAPDGTVTASIPEGVIFKDEAGFRPVCPFFELHGEWDEGRTRHCGALTPDVLQRCGLSLSDVRWSVHVANSKPYHYTLSDRDRIEATLDLQGDDTVRHILRGVTPTTPVATAGPRSSTHTGPVTTPAKPLVPPGSFVPLGTVQLTRPSSDFPGLRLRFSAPGGFVYGPQNLPARLENLRKNYNPRGRNPRRWETFTLPTAQLFLDPEADWCTYEPPGPRNNPDTNTVPASLYAFEDLPGTTQRALGLVDDMSDGLISCSVAGLEPARARVVVTPPDFAPDRRPLVSIADDLKDRVDRDEVFDPTYVADEELTGLEFRDVMERVWETVGLMNVDLQNERSASENSDLTPSTGRMPGRDLHPFPHFDLIGEDRLPLTARARDRHRRFAALEVFETILREHPNLIATIVREPVSNSVIYDERMPALMRGSDGNPLTLTRRQYQLLQAWLETLRKKIRG